MFIFRTGLKFISLIITDFFVRINVFNRFELKFFILHILTFQKLDFPSSKKFPAKLGNTRGQKLLNPRAIIEN